jgi:hypothetical protein
MHKSSIENQGNDANNNLKNKKMVKDYVSERLKGDA